MRISSRAPCPGFDSIVSSPASKRTLSRITAGPFPEVSNSACDIVPENEKPRPSSSTVNCSLSALCPRRTSTLRAPECLRTFTRLSCTMRASSRHTFCGSSMRSNSLTNCAETPVSRRNRSTISVIKPRSRSAFTSNDFISCINSRNFRSEALELADELRGNPRLTPEPLHHIGNKAQKPVGVHLERLHLLHQFTQLQRSEEHTSELQSLRHLVCRL